MPGRIRPLTLVYKIYQRPALVDAQAPDPPGRRNAQLLHDGGGTDLPDAGQRLQQFGRPASGPGRRPFPAELMMSAAERCPFFRLSLAPPG